MDRMIRNIDPQVYRLLKTRAAAEGRPIGEVLNDAILAYAAKPRATKSPKKKRGLLSNLPVIDFGPGSEDWSENKLEAIYGGDP